MQVIYLILAFALSSFLPSAHAADFGTVLGDVLKSTTAGEEKKEKAPDPAGSQSKKAFNLQAPSRTEEIQLGREITGNLLGAAPLVKDAALQKYVNQVGRWVANQSERGDLPWRFGVIETEDINAFAAPGGYVIVTKGLYRRLENEAQRPFVTMT